MQIFIKDHDYEVQEIISQGNFVPTVKEGDKIVPKPMSEFTHEKTEKVAKNQRAILFYDLDSNEFNRVSACDIAKDVWDTLETPYEGISQV